jgi:predicted dehydrogenase
MTRRSGVRVVALGARDPGRAEAFAARHGIPGGTGYEPVIVAAVQDGTPFPTDAADAVATMRLIDDRHRASGLEPRRPAHAVVR